MRHTEMDCRFPGIEGGKGFSIVCAVILMLSLSASAFGVLQGEGAENLEASLVPAVDKNPKVDSRLIRLARMVSEEGRPAAEQFAEANRIRWTPEGWVRVLIHAQPQPEYRGGDAVGSSVSAAEEGLLEAAEKSITEAVEQLGGASRGRTKNLIAADLPAGSVLQLAARAEIAWIEPSPQPVPLEVVSQGVEVVGAASLQESNAEYRPTDRKVHVGVLDLGFRGFRGLLGSELPESITFRSFHSNGIQGNTPHGTGVAEIVHDMAPTAQLSFANFDDLLSHDRAVSWLISQDVDVISYSIGWVNAGPGDGRGPVNDDVRRALGKGIHWVGAAGNDAQRHWEDRFRDPDNDGWHNYQGTDETNEVRLAAGDPLVVWLNWTDWFRTDQDYDLFVFGPPGLTLWAASTNLQFGSQPPVEAVGLRAPLSGTYHVAVRWAGGQRSRTPVDLEAFFIAPRKLEYNRVRGSLTIPADTDGSIAVGATHWRRDRLEFFSSRGPTTDGRVKPDISAPDGVANLSISPFFGTSAATPHVSGAIALMKSRFGLYTFDEIVEILMGRAVDKGDPGKDTRYGVGRLDVRGGE